MSSQTGLPFSSAAREEAREGRRWRWSRSRREPVSAGYVNLSYRGAARCHASAVVIDKAVRRAQESSAVGAVRRDGASPLRDGRPAGLQDPESGRPGGVGRPGGYRLSGRQSSRSNLRTAPRLASSPAAIASSSSMLCWRAHRSRRGRHDLAACRRRVPEMRLDTPTDSNVRGRRDRYAVISPWSR